MALPQDGQNANALATVKEVPTGKKLIFVDPTTNEGGIITLEDLTTQILKKLTSQTFVLDQGTKTLPVALNELNSNPFLRYERTYGTSLTVSNVRGATHGLILIGYTLIPFYISGSSTLGYTIATPQLPDGISVSNNGYTVTITTKTAQVITCIYPYMK